MYVDKTIGVCMHVNSCKAKCMYGMRYVWSITFYYCNYILPAARAKFALGRVLTYIAGAHIEGNQAVQQHTYIHPHT